MRGDFELERIKADLALLEGRRKEYKKIKKPTKYQAKKVKIIEKKISKEEEKAEWYIRAKKSHERVLAKGVIRR